MVRCAVTSNNRKTAKAYDYKKSQAVLRPDIGIQAQFKREKKSGTTSEPFAGEHNQIWVKVIDDRNELLVVKKLSEAETK